ncbi:MAG TPA: hypothetical protein VM240_06835 [Verrucomicrobiae bacterium]|nr:hypothetical protein [Verrucomicrobiae bacterium]
MRILLLAFFLAPSLAILFWMGKRLLAQPRQQAWQGLPLLALWGVMAALVGNGALTAGNTDSPLTLAVVVLLLASWGGVIWLFTRHPIQAKAPQ